MVHSNGARYGIVILRSSKRRLSDMIPQKLNWACYMSLREIPPMAVEKLECRAHHAQGQHSESRTVTFGNPFNSLPMELPWNNAPLLTNTMITEVNTRLCQLQYLI